MGEVGWGITDHDGLAKEVLHLPTEVGVSTLSILLRVKGHVPVIVVGKFTTDEPGTLLAAKQVLHLLQDDISRVQ